MRAVPIVGIGEHSRSRNASVLTAVSTGQTRSMAISGTAKRSLMSREPSLMSRLRTFDLQQTVRAVAYHLPVGIVNEQIAGSAWVAGYGPQHHGVGREQAHYVMAGCEHGLGELA